VDTVNFNAPAFFNIGSPLERKNGILRAEVATELMKSTSNVNTNLAPDDERIVDATLPAATEAVILHARYIKDEGQTFMLEATLLQVVGVPRMVIIQRLYSTFRQSQNI
jgi:hypothetical protein